LSFHFLSIFGQNYKKKISSLRDSKTFINHLTIFFYFTFQKLIP